ncbi:MAG: Allophanate hydrolase 2 subunit 2 [Frankiales bacterium]|nr:Allophanate hydrolase 2 subunit 2 [Frankiales bacterium]
MLRVEATGPLVLVQDRGRPGLAHLGVGCSGAADPIGLAVANAAVGNPLDAPALEVLLGGLVLTALDEVSVAVGTRRHDLVPGEVIALEHGALRQYVAVRGGVSAVPVLGSCSRDTLADLGPQPLQVGDVVTAGSLPRVTTAPETHDGLIRLHPGPRADHFHPGTLDLLATASWTVSATSDRTAVRLEGPTLQRRTTTELQPEGLIPGAMQVPPNGQPLVFLNDHPVTGGYPVVAVVERRDLRVLAQAPPGSTVSFVATW